MPISHIFAFMILLLRAANLESTFNVSSREFPIISLASFVYADWSSDSWMEAEWGQSSGGSSVCKVPIPLNPVAAADYSQLGVEGGPYEITVEPDVRIKAYRIDEAGNRVFLESSFNVKFNDVFYVGLDIQRNSNGELMKVLWDQRYYDPSRPWDTPRDYSWIAGSWLKEEGAMCKVNYGSFYSRVVSTNSTDSGDGTFYTVKMYAFDFYPSLRAMWLDSDGVLRATKYPFYFVRTNNWDQVFTLSPVSSKPSISLVPSQPSKKPSRRPRIHKPTKRPTLLPTTASPGHSPSEEPSCTPHESPTFVPSFIPSPVVSCTPSVRPTNMPTEWPSNIPMIAPTSMPTECPSNVMMIAPTSMPTECPSNTLMVAPTSMPTACPSNILMIAPTSFPTECPSNSLMVAPTSMPTACPSNILMIAPTSFPTECPSNIPMIAPTPISTECPSNILMVAPTSLPTDCPSNIPMIAPTSIPTECPSNIPTIAPTSMPTECPSYTQMIAPTSIPTECPSNIPMIAPTSMPTEYPSNIPTIAPTNIPTGFTSSTPIVSPNYIPTGLPVVIDFSTNVPAGFPSIAPMISSTYIPTDHPIRSPTSLPSSFPLSSPIVSPKSSFIPTSLVTDMPFRLLKPSNQPTSIPSNMFSDVPMCKSLCPSMYMPSSEPTLIPSLDLSVFTVFPSVFTIIPTEVLQSNSIDPTTTPSPTVSDHPSATLTMEPSSKGSTISPSASLTSLSSHIPTGIPSHIPFEVPSSSPSTDVPTGTPFDGLLPYCNSDSPKICTELVCTQVLIECIQTFDGESLDEDDIATLKCTLAAVTGLRKESISIVNEVERFRLQSYNLRYIFDVFAEPYGFTSGEGLYRSIVYNITRSMETNEFNKYLENKARLNGYGFPADAKNFTFTNISPTMVPTYMANKTFSESFRTGGGYLPNSSTLAYVIYGIVCGLTLSGLTFAAIYHYRKNSIPAAKISSIVAYVGKEDFMKDNWEIVPEDGDPLEWIYTHDADDAVLTVDDYSLSTPRQEILRIGYY